MSPLALFRCRTAVAAMAGWLLLATSSAMAQVVLHEISGMVWHDRVPDGIRAPHEAGLGIPDFTVELRDGSTNAVLGTATTDAAGRYVFRFGSTQPSRGYRIFASPSWSRYRGFSPRQAGSDRTVDSDIHPSGPFQGHSEVFVVTPNAPATHMDIGMIPITVVIGDFAWFDRSANGLQHAFEPGLQGLVVEAWNPERNLRFDQTVTGVDGKYRLQVPGWGPYRLRFESPAGTSFTERHAGDDGGIDSDVIASGANAGWTGVVQVGMTTIVMASVDAGYLVDADGVDVALDYAEPTTVVFPGFGATWSLRVREGLGKAVTTVRVRAPVPVGIQGMSWTCQGSGGATCPPAGVNGLDFTVTLPGNGQLHIGFAGQVLVGAPPVLVASAETTVSGTQLEAIPANSVGELWLRNDRLFAHGFQ